MRPLGLKLYPVEFLKMANLGEIAKGHNRSRLIKTGHVKTGHVKIGHDKTGQVKIGQVG